MKTKAILFDLDGTLLPMDLEVFTKAYFKGLAKKLAPCGYDPKVLIDAVWAGTGSMIKNNGSRTNEQVFWDKFAEIFGEQSKKDIDKFEEFYKVEFQEIKNLCGFNPQSAQVIKILKEKGFRLVIASNPIFPEIATKSRMEWAGLNVNDFEYITTYENSSYSKPNPNYYLEIMNKLGLQPEECLMIGNDVREDMVAKEIGIKVFLLTDCLINKEDKDISIYPNGNFYDLIKYIEKEC